MPMEILRTLENLSIASFAGQTHKSVVRLNTSSTVKDALKTFHAEKILSCPISNSDQGSDVFGFLDVFDLLSYLLELWEENQQAETDDVAQLGDRFLNHTVSDLLDRSDNDVYAAVIGEEQAHRLVRLFGLGVHRVALLDLMGSLNSIISQSDVVKYLNTNIKLLGENADMTIKELNMISTDKLIVAESDQSALSAFKLLGSNLVSAVPIVDKEGIITGTLSVSDLKLLKDDVSSLLQTTAQYKSTHEQHPQIVCKPDTTLGAVIGMLANSNVHRVWVVDEQQKPVSVISITNVCEFLSQFLSEDSDN